MAIKESVTVKVPATTSNIGPGFDCLGLALAFYNEITISRTSSKTISNIGHEPSGQSIVKCAAQAYFLAAETKEFRFDWDVPRSEVPMARGLGSSATLRLGVLSGLNHLSGNLLTQNQIFRLAATLEGHPDNAAAAMFGGFVVTNGRTHSRIEVDPGLKFAILIPDAEVRTSEARTILPTTVPTTSLARNIQNACQLVSSFAQRQYDGLPGLFDDHLHQPYRASLLPGLYEVIDAGVQAGALGGFLSGSGSSIICVAYEGNSDLVVHAMEESHNRYGTSTSLISCADNLGARIAL